MILVLAGTCYGQTLPTSSVDTTLKNTSGYTVKAVRTSGGDYTDLATAITAAACGTVITVQHGQTFVLDSYALPNKGCTDSGWVYIVSDDISPATMVPSHLPVYGKRVNPSNISYMPTIQNNGTVTNPIIADSDPATDSYYRFIGLDFESTGDNDNGPLVVLGSNNTAETSHRIIVDRSIFHGGATWNDKYGLFLESYDSAVIDSYIYEFHMVSDGESKAILLPCTGHGPYLLNHNYLEAAGENVMLGGGGPGNCLDVTITNNYFFKPETWNPSDPSYGGIHWNVKNLFEVKSCSRCLIQGNVYLNNWVDGQPGPAVPIWGVTSTNTGALADNITFQLNIIRNTPTAINNPGCDSDGVGNTCASTGGISTHNVTFQNNLFDGLFGSGFTCIQQWGVANGKDSHNTCVYQSSSPNSYTLHGFGTTEGFPEMSNFIFNDNIGESNSSATIAIVSDGCCFGNAAFADMSSSHTTLNDAIVGTDSTTEPPTYISLANWAAVKFVNYNNGINGDYRLCTGTNLPASPCSGASPLHNAASDGTDVGANIPAVISATCAATLDDPISCTGGGGSSISSGETLSSGNSIQ